MSQSIKKYADSSNHAVNATLVHIPLSPSKKALPSVLQIAESKPENSVFAFRPHTLSKAVHFFQQNFHAKKLYAVKTNPEPNVINLLKNHQVLSYDVASLSEIKLIREHIQNAELYFMHPVKSQEAIERAYFIYGIRHFSLDSQDELEKILKNTGFAKDLHLHLRLAIPNQFAEMNLTKKFGIAQDAAPTLLRSINQHAAKTGICFHVGSQCTNPLAYQIAIRMASQVMLAAHVPIHSLNVGGGFPSIYPNLRPPPLMDYFHVIHTEFNQLLHQFPNLQLLSEPGRALVAESTSLIVRIELRKGNFLYLNDGTYGSLFDAGIPGFIFPMRLLRHGANHSQLIPFQFYGPTCDSLDYMPGPFYLPEDTKAGDYIEIGQLGAYSKTLATHFNGFRHEEDVVTVSDEPLLTMYGDHQTPLESTHSFI